MSYQVVIEQMNQVLNAAITVESEALTLTTVIPICEHDMVFAQAQIHMDLMKQWTPWLRNHAKEAEDQLDEHAQPVLWSKALNVSMLATNLESHIDALLPVPGQLPMVMTIHELASQLHHAAMDLSTEAGNALVAESRESS